MTVQTLNRPDADLLDELDYKPTCDLSFVRIHPLTKQPYGEPVPCQNPASWAGYRPCCNGLVLVCDSHRHGLGVKFCCAQCRIIHDDLNNWTRL